MSIFRILFEYFLLSECANIKCVKMSEKESCVPPEPSQLQEHRTVCESPVSAPFPCQYSDPTKPEASSSSKSMPLQQPGKDFKTSDLYAVRNLPPRFNNPSWFKNYGHEFADNLLYQTTSFEYGRYPPCVHTVPVVYRPKGNQFSKKQAVGGMYRNYSLNCTLNPGDREMFVKHCQ